MAAKYVKGMIVTKREWSDGQNTFNSCLFCIFFIIMLFPGVLFEEYLEDTVYLIVSFGSIILIGFFSLWNSTTYQLQINSEEEYNKIYPKYIGNRERNNLIVSSLEDIKKSLSKLESRGRK